MLTCKICSTHNMWNTDQEMYLGETYQYFHKIYHLKPIEKSNEI